MWGALNTALDQVCLARLEPGGLVKPCKTPGAYRSACWSILGSLLFLEMPAVMPSKSRTVLYFLLAVLLTSVLGAVLQTQFNLANLQALGAPMPLMVRLHTTGLDLLGFSPTFAVLVICGLSVGLAAGGPAGA